MQTTINKYIQYSKRIAIFGIVQWSIIAVSALIATFVYNVNGKYFDNYTVQIINNIVTCSSALAVAICSGYYAHSAYDNSLKQKVASALDCNEIDFDDSGTGNG